ncbi:flagellar basal body rod protein FlgC [Candidatus Margulisiibacteriota bacterium]
MGINDAFDISVSGINANRIHMELISSNLANINTTRTMQGGPYRRKVPVFSETPVTFDSTLTKANKKMGGGVEVSEIVEDLGPFPKVYKPGHPDADQNGFVSLPNVSMSKEMIDMVYVSKLYEANITVFNTTKSMAQQTLQIQ